MKVMILIAGLGNPGKKYLATRHNIGKLVVESWRETADFPNFKFQKKFNALLSEGTFDKKRVILALPETFVNNSGESIKSLFAYYKLPVTNLWVFHDDIDLPLGRVKIVKNRGAAGHKGVESIIKAINSKNFVRFRIGIRPLEIKKVKNLERFVLQGFTKKEREMIKKVIQKTIQAMETAIGENFNKAMQKYNQ